MIKGKKQEVEEKARKPGTPLESKGLPVWLLNETLPKAQRTRGLSSAFESILIR